MQPQQTILIVRHADKPEKGVRGVNISGQYDEESLTPKGWQRAGIWSELFVPSLGSQSQLPTPTALYASAPKDKEDEKKSASGASKSQRPLETLKPLAAKLKPKGIEINLSFHKGQEVDLARAISALSGTVLVCWQHEDILAISRALVPTPNGLPADWPGECYNVVFRFDRAAGAPEWTFKQVVPVMLAGDQTGPL